MQSASPSRTLVATRIDGSLRGRISEPGRRVAVVHSVFRAALNISVGGDLITVAPEEGGGLPGGILVPALVDVRTHGVRAGLLVEVDGTSLHIAETGSVIRLDAADLWSAQLIVSDGRTWPRRSPVAHSLAARDSSGRERSAGGLAAMPGARRQLAAVCRSIERSDIRGAGVAARPLIGLGPGLTPSGDDALAGLEAALHALGHPAAGFLATALADVHERTTDVSAALLRHAAHGAFAERVHRLLDALLGEDDAVLPDAIEQGIAWGATSGMDCLTGILEGLDVGTTQADRLAVA